MWQVVLSKEAKQFWSATDRFVQQFLDYAQVLQRRNLTDAELKQAAAHPPGELGQAATPSVQDYLVRFARSAELSTLVRGFRRVIHSYRFYMTYPSHPLISLTEETHGLLHEALRYFYDGLIDTKAFRETYLGMKGKGETGRRYRELFGAKHRTCPYCDLELIAKLPNSQIDHFLPKHQHPMLAVHGPNLVVSCTSCNAGVKARTSLGHRGNTVENLPIFHPFYEQAADSIRLRFNRDMSKVWIRSVGRPGSLSATKVRNWVRVFGLEAQYAAHLPKLRHLRRELRDRTKLNYRRVRLSGGEADLGTLYDEVVAFEEEKWKEWRRFEPGAKLNLDFLIHLRTECRDEELSFLQTVV